MASFQTSREKVVPKAYGTEDNPGFTNHLVEEERPVDLRPTNELGQSLEEDGSVSANQPVSVAEKRRLDEAVAAADLEQRQDEEDAEVSPSVGTSSSQSETKPDKSGQISTNDLQSPVPDAENLSGKDQSLAPGQSQIPESSSASSTAGSTQGTGSDQQSQQPSSEDSGGSSSKSRGKRS